MSISVTVRGTGYNTKLVLPVVLRIATHMVHTTSIRRSGVHVNKWGYNRTIVTLPKLQDRNIVLISNVVAE